MASYSIFSPFLLATVQYKYLCYVKNADNFQLQEFDSVSSLSTLKSKRIGWNGTPELAITLYYHQAT